jgi:hypothetical protein
MKQKQKKAMQKDNKTELFFEKIKKINKLLSKLTKGSEDRNYKGGILQ